MKLVLKAQALCLACLGLTDGLTILVSVTNSEHQPVGSFALGFQFTLALVKGPKGTRTPGGSVQFPQFAVPPTKFSLQVEKLQFDVQGLYLITATPTAAPKELWLPGSYTLGIELQIKGLKGKVSSGAGEVNFDVPDPK